MKTLTLFRTMYCKDGIFGELTDDTNTLHLVTLEHAYPEGELIIPKVPDGSYMCVRGVHKLDGMDHSFATFMLLGVPPFRSNPVTGILFHVGNYNAESKGCVLVGRQIGHKSDGGKMIMQSKDAFADFMKLLSCEDKFKLVVVTQGGIHPIVA